MSYDGAIVSSAPNFDMSWIDCNIAATNGDYRFDNNTFGQELLKYVSFPIIENTTTTSDFVVLKLWKGDNSRLKVTINDPKGAYDSYDESLTDLLLKYIPEIDMGDIEALDIEIKVDVTPGKVLVTIVAIDYEIVDVEGGI